MSDVPAPRLLTKPFIAVTAVGQVGRADEDDGDAVGHSPLGALDDLARRTVAAHGVDRDGQHQVVLTR